MSLVKKIREYMDNSPYLKPYLLMWLRKTTKTINKWPEEKFINGVMECYKRHMGYTFDIKKPQLFTEKLQWYKIFYECKDFGLITDKALFKQYVKEKLGEGHTIPIYGVWENLKDLEKDWSLLPEEFVLKANLQADARNIKFIHKKSDVNFKSLKKELKLWMKPWNTLLNSWDCHFYNSTPKILAEEFMANFEDVLYDYKFFCFNGEPYCMYAAKNGFGKAINPITFYDMNWKRIPVKYGEHANEDCQKPIHFAEMVKMAKILSKGFPFVRVDFFDTPQKPYVAEMTFAPGGGCTPYDPVSFNKELGDLFDLREKE